MARGETGGERRTNEMTLGTRQRESPARNGRGINEEEERLPGRPARQLRLFRLPAGEEPRLGGIGSGTTLRWGVEGEPGGWDQPRQGRGLPPVAELESTAPVGVLALSAAPDFPSFLGGIGCRPSLALRSLRPFCSHGQPRPPGLLFPCLTAFRWAGQKRAPSASHRSWDRVQFPP